MKSSRSPAFSPYIPASASLREFTPRALIVGTLLGMVFGASSVFLTLKIGLTVSASIPVAVISMTLFRLWSKMGGRDATILEHNIAQTAGSAGESLAFGIGVTLPAILILGFDLELSRALFVAVLGGLLGILLMIPLRRALIVQQHGTLKYPEGTACAEVLKAGANDESRASSQDPSVATSGIQAGTIFAGFGIGLIYNLLSRAGKLWKETVGHVFGPPLQGGSIAADITPEMLGVGYIIGPRVGGVMAAGAVLSYLALVPIIKFVGLGLSAPLEPGRKLISEMSVGELRNAYILYIGAGAVAAGGLISLVRSLPTIWRGVRSGLADFGSAGAAAATRSGGGTRTERDLSIRFVLFGVAALLAGICLIPSLKVNFVGALLILVFGFLFATVSSRLTGEIGSSSNPISGMTIATLLFTCLIFRLCGWTGPGYYVMALSVGAIVCVASSNAGTTSQDLKTGYLVGATPRLQQMAILLGAAASALVLGPVLLTLNNDATTYMPAAQVAPGMTVPASELSNARRERLVGPHARIDPAEYRVWHQADPGGGNSRKFLVDDSGKPVWLVDPGINGQFPDTPNGPTVKKLDAPKAVLVSYIIKGILGGKLPWALVLIGAMITIGLELCGIGSLAFAVGVYLPFSVSLPIFIGGLVRWLVDFRRERKSIDSAGGATKTPEELLAEADRSPGVLMASGYIAGGSIAGIFIAYMAARMPQTDERITKWAEASNPFFGGPTSNLLSLIPFAILLGVLIAAGSGLIFSGKRK